MRKGVKLNNRIRKVREDTLFNLYYKLPRLCATCCYNSNCPHIENMNEIDVTSCDNYKETIELNDLILMMKEQNINIDSFCEKFKVKKEYFMEMIKGKMLLSYKYYIALCTRLHVPQMDEFYIYESRFEIKNENKTLECEVQIDANLL